LIERNESLAEQPSIDPRSVLGFFTPVSMKYWSV